MLDILPFDIIHHISLYINPCDIHNLILIKNIYDIDDKSAFIRFREFQCNKIKLFLRLRYRQRLLFNQLKIILDKHYYTMISTHDTTFPLFNNQCLLYAPLIPYNRCRFCSLHLSNHKYHKMINMFLELVY